MRAEITKHINQLEVEQGITILMAIESGSRAWGCPSPDSDYDVRIIFKRTEADYLSIDEKSDTIDYFHGKLLDINGWDLKKTFKLIRRSNATPFEWAQSPIVYKEREDFRKTLLDLCKEYFQPKHSVNHYKGIAKNSYYGNDLTGKMKLKTLFYILRPLMAATWIIDKGTVPPMDIPNLLPTLKDNAIVDIVRELLLLKERSNEDYIHEMDPYVSNFIENKFEWITNMELKDSKEKFDSKLLNEKFTALIKA